MAGEVMKVSFPDESTKFKSVNVEKLIELTIDTGTLLAIDTNDLDNKKLKNDRDKYLMNLARDNTQLLCNKIWDLPTERVEDAVVAKLPRPTTVLPREKPVPKPKPLTKWQQFAKDKGLKKTKKSNVTWDDMLKKWVPRYGYKRAAAEREKDWVLEVPDNADPNEDLFQKKADEKKERVSKNEFQRLRNIAKSKNMKVPAMGIPPTEKLSSIQLNSAAKIANVSTASLGKFQPKLSKEKTLNNKSVLQAKKKKLPAPTREEECSGYINIADSILQKKPKIDFEKAANREIHAQETQASIDKQDTRKKNKHLKPKGGKKKTVSNKNRSSFNKSRKPKGIEKGKPSFGKKRR